MEEVNKHIQQPQTESNQQSPQPDSQSPKVETTSQHPVEPPPQPKKKKWLIPVLVILALLFLGFIGYFGYQGYVLKKNKQIKLSEYNPIEAKQSLNSLSPTVDDSSLKYCPTIKEQSKQVKFIQDLSGALYSIVLSNDFERNYNNYNYVYNNNDYEVVIETFVNFEGEITEESYEGSQPTTRIYNKEKQTYLDLKEGLHITEVWHDLDYDLSEVAVKNIGSKKFLVYDSGFAPAGTLSRIYLTLSDRKDRIVYIKITTYNSQDRIDTESVTDNDIYKVISYPKNFQGFINEMESVIAEIIRR